MKIMVIDSAVSLESRSNSIDLCNAYKLKVGNENFRFMDYRKDTINDIMVYIEDWKPDYIHLGKCETFDGDILSCMKKNSGAYILHYYGDFRNEIQQWVASIGRIADVTYFPHKDSKLITQYKSHGIKNIKFYFAGVNVKKYGRSLIENPEYDFVFMGNNNKLNLSCYSYRLSVLNYLVEKYKVLIHGEGWNDFVGKATVRQFVIEEKFRNAVQSGKFFLNLSGVDGIDCWCSWPRLLRGLMSGKPVLSPRIKGLEELFPSVIYFDELEELDEIYDKGSFYNSAGVRNVEENHTWEKRIERLLNDYRISK